MINSKRAAWTRLRHGSTRWIALCAMTAFLAACGGGGDSGTDGGAAPTPEPARGQLISAAPLRTYSAAEILNALDSPDSDVPAISVRHAVEAWRITYTTADSDGTLIRASGLLALPQGADHATTPVISYQHPTTFYNVEAPSADTDPGAPPVALAGLGTIVAAADYIGFGASNDRPHPYLLSAPTAHAVVDLLAAANQWRSEHGITDNGALYLMGYSEGGYATMAAQREMERTQNPLMRHVVAAIPGAGPYDVQVTLDAYLQRVRDEYPVLGALIRPGGLLQMSREIRAEVRRLILRQILPDDADVSYDARFLDNYLADNRAAIKNDSSVHWGWTPMAPIFLFHGRDDQTVPFAASVAALDTLGAAGGAPVTLQECTRVPSSHTGCVPEYLAYALQVMMGAGLVR